MPLPQTSLDWFNYLYPYFNDCNDRRYMSPDKIQTALLIGDNETPACEALTAAKRAEAIAHYAAFQLNTIYGNKRNNGAAHVSETDAVIREKTGNREVQFAAPAAAPVEIDGNGTPYEAWLRLANLCPRNVGFRLTTRRI